MSSSSPPPSPPHERRGRSPTQRSSQSPINVNSNQESPDDYTTSSWSILLPTFLLCLKCILLSLGVTFIAMLILYPNEVSTLFQEEFSSSGGATGITGITGITGTTSTGGNTPQYYHRTQEDLTTATNAKNAPTSEYDTNTIKDPNAIVYRMDYIPRQCTEQSNNTNTATTTTHTLNTPETPKCHDNNQLLLTQEMKHAFQQDGVIALRGLLSPDLLSQLNQSSMTIINKQVSKTGRKPGTVSGKQFYTTQMGVMFGGAAATATAAATTGGGVGTTADGGSSSSSTRDQHHGSSSSSSSSIGFRNVALSSLVPQIAAELMGLTTTTMMEEEKEEGDLGVVMVGDKEKAGRKVEKKEGYRNETRTSVHMLR